MERALGREPSSLPLLAEPSQVPLPPWSSVFPSVQGQDLVPGSWDALRPGTRASFVDSHRGSCSETPHPCSNPIILRFLMIF